LQTKCWGRCLVRAPATWQDRGRKIALVPCPPTPHSGLQQTSSSPICYFSPGTQRDSCLRCLFCREVASTLHCISDIKVIAASPGLCQLLRQFWGKRWQPQHRTSRDDDSGSQPGLHSSYFCTYETTCNSNISSQLFLSAHQLVRFSIFPFCNMKFTIFLHYPKPGKYVCPWNLSVTLLS